MIQITSAISRTDMKKCEFGNIEVEKMQDVPETETEMTMFLSPMIMLMASALKNKNIK